MNLQKMEIMLCSCTGPSLIRWWHPPRIGKEVKFQIVPPAVMKLSNLRDSQVLAILNLRELALKFRVEIIINNCYIREVSRQIVTITHLSSATYLSRISSHLRPRPRQRKVLNNWTTSSRQGTRLSTSAAPKTKQVWFFTTQETCRATAPTRLSSLMAPRGRASGTYRYLLITNHERVMRIWLYTRSS